MTLPGAAGGGTVDMHKRTVSRGNDLDTVPGDSAVAAFQRAFNGDKCLIVQPVKTESVSTD